jgi:hypothetical protein
MSKERKIIKFHGAEVKNVIILYAIRPNSNNSNRTIRRIKR